MDTLFKKSRSFASLSLKDLLEARDLFHYHLMNKKNVVATAIGLYRIRKRTHWPSPLHPEPQARSRKSPRRTLFNSEVRPYSWPCVYVFVSQWSEEEKLAQDDPFDVVPERLYLPDGRVVPVCVIEARKQSLARDLRVDLKSTPRNLLGPGSAILNEDSQGLSRLATAGCVVRDGDRYYVLTNRHAVGAPGKEIHALQAHRRPHIGVSADKGLTREDFRKIYPHFASTDQFLLMDVGLIDLDDITQWKTDFPGVSPIGPVLDLYDNSFSVHLIGLKVVGDSAVTGRIRGEIHGLFYRFKAMGGSEYISDFLIGPETYGGAEKEMEEGDGENVSLSVQHGDSGTVLFIEHIEGAAPADGSRKPKKTYHPFALLWGKNEFIEDDRPVAQPFALATCLSTALNRLDLDVVRDVNLDQDYVWGWVGHYVIGGLLPAAIGLLKAPELKKFTDKNLDLLTISPDNALGNDPRVIPADQSNAKHPRFVPLADVPDNVWKSNVNFYSVIGADGKPHRAAGPGSRGQADNPNHFADLDLPYKGHATFLEFVQQDFAANLDPAVWLAYYAANKPRYDAWAAALGKPKSTYGHWGALPFRVWQLFSTMVDAASNGKPSEFLCAGGVLIHYVGDACQPLHTSYLSQGDPDRVVSRPQSTGKILEADGVHGGYEDDMVSYGYVSQNLAARLETEVRRQEKDAKEKIARIARGKDAARAVIELVAATRKTLAPADIVDKWVELRGTARKDRAPAMWTVFGDPTIECLARGSRYLARLWHDAWTVGHGKQKIGEGIKVKPADIMKLYNDPKFVPSVRLDKYAPILK